jgi:hypothetical protein
MLRVFLQVLFAWQRGRGRALGIADGHTGSVSLLQRFGSALNSHVHCHRILPDGLFVPVSDEPSAPLRVVPLPAPTTAEVEELTQTVADRLTARLAAASEEEDDYLDPDLAALVEALFWSRDAPPAVSPQRGTRDIPLLPGLEREVVLPRLAPASIQAPTVNARGTLWAFHQVRVSDTVIEKSSCAAFSRLGMIRRSLAG